MFIQTILTETCLFQILLQKLDVKIRNINYELEDFSNKLSNPKNGYLSPELVPPHEFRVLRDIANSQLSGKRVAVDDVSAYADTCPISRLYDENSKYLIFLIYIPLEDSLPGNDTPVASSWDSIHDHVADNLPWFVGKLWFWVVLILGVLVAPDLFKYAIRKSWNYLRNFCPFGRRQPQNQTNGNDQGLTEEENRPLTNGTNQRNLHLQVPLPEAGTYEAMIRMPNRQN